MNISLTPYLEGYIKQKVATGMYNSVSEVIREAIRLMEDQDSLQKMKLEALKVEINKGLESLKSGKGKVLDIESIEQRGRQMLETRDLE